MQIKLIRPALFGIVLLFLMMIAGIGSADEVNVDFVSHLGGTIYDVAVAGDYAYIGQGQDLVVLDISDKSNPLVVGKLTTSSIINYVAVSGEYAYVTCWDKGLVIVDITNPVAPKIAGSYKPSYEGIANTVTVSGDYVYVGVLNGFDILDITNPSSPIKRGEYRHTTYPSAYGSVKAVSGNYAYYIGNNVLGFEIVDIRNPSSPTRVCSYTGIAYPRDVTVLGNYAYLTGEYQDIAILNITNSSSPTFVGSYSSNDASSNDLAVSGKYVYIANSNSGDNGITIIDITNVSSPKLVGKCDTGYSSHVTLSDNHAYVVNSQTGLAIIDVANASSPKITGNFDSNLSDARRVSLAGDYAYIADKHGSSVVNIKDPSSPKFVTNYSNGGTIFAIATSNNYAYAADEYNGFIVLNISNPAAPKLAGSYDTGGHSEDIAVSSNYAYVADGDKGLVIVDISNPSSPKLAGRYYDGRYAVDVAVSGNYAYVADGYNDLMIVNISNPSSPKLAGSYNVGNYDVGRYVADVAVSANYAYVADGYNGLIIVDISNPSSPKLAGSYDTLYFAEGVYVSGNYAYITSIFGGLYVVDITNPALPIIAAHYATAGVSYNSCTRDNYVYVADERNGLVILQTNIQNQITVGQDASTSEIEQLFIDAYNRNGGSSVLGNPTTIVYEKFGFEVQDFPGTSGIPGGVIMYNPIKNNASYIHGAIWNKYSSYVDKSKLGPLADDEKEAAISPKGTTGRYTKFETGTIHWISDEFGENLGNLPRGKSFVTYGGLDEVYTNLGGTYSDLGFPIMDQVDVEGHGYCEFEKGWIEWNEDQNLYEQNYGNNLHQKIRTSLMRKTYNPENLLDSKTNKLGNFLMIANSVLKSTELRKKYNEFYYSSLEYNDQRTYCLSNSLKAINNGDIARAEKYYKDALMYERMSYLSYAASAQVYIGDVDSAEKTVQSMRDTLLTGVTLGNPIVGQLTDFLFMYVDYQLVDRDLLGEEEALKQLKLKFAINVLINNVPVPDLGGQTIDKYLYRFYDNRGGKYLFPIIQALEKEEKTQFILSKTIKQAFTAASIDESEEAIQNIVHFLLNEAKSGANVQSEIIAVKSPVELRVYNSKGNVTGIVDGMIREEIPYSIYDSETKTVLIYIVNDTYTYETVGTANGTYGLEIVHSENATDKRMNIENITTSINSTHDYTVDWNNDLQSMNVQLNIDANGDGEFEQINSMHAPNATFSIQPENVVANQNIDFDASSSSDQDGNILNYEWNFGDGTNESGKMVEHIYASSGTYLVSLSVRDDDGLVDNDSVFLTVVQSSMAEVGENEIDLINEYGITIHCNVTYPTSFILADYDNSPLGDFANESTLFNQIDLSVENESGVEIPVYIKMFYTQQDLDSRNLTEDQLQGIFLFDNETSRWRLCEDSGVSTQDQAEYSGYCWANTNKLHCTYAIGRMNYISSSPLINEITLNKALVKAGEDILVTVNATDNIEVSSVEANNISLAYTGENIWAGNITAIEGTNIVRVRATDLIGNVVWHNSTTYTAVSSNVLEANFTANITSGAAPLTVRFTDLSTNATSWKWDFGDGTNSTEQNPLHIYIEGNYTVSLNASSPAGYNTATKVDYIIVADWNPWNDSDSDGGESITLSELQQAIYDWRFGIPVSTGEMVNLTRLQELIYSWRFG